MVNSLLISCFEGYELAKQEVFPVSPVEFVAVMDFVAQHDMDSDLVRRSLYEADEPALRRFGIQIAIMESEHQEYMGDIRFMIGPARTIRVDNPREKKPFDWMGFLMGVARTLTISQDLENMHGETHPPYANVSPHPPFDPSQMYRHEQYRASMEEEEKVTTED